MPALPGKLSNACKHCAPATPNERDLPMDPKLLELLVCPVTKGPLRYDRERQELVSRSARLAYPVRDGIPVMLEVEARALSDDEIDAIAAGDNA